MTDQSAYGVSFVSLPGATTVEIIDPIERHRFSLDTGRDVRLRSTNPRSFLYPVDAAVTFETQTIDFPYIVAIYVRTTDGELIEEIEHSVETSFSSGDYILEVCCPIKSYIEVSSAFDVVSDGDTISIVFDRETEISIGARSAHERPQGTLRTTDQPEDMMQVISSFGSALKTTSPERTFPTLRGHPPEIELADDVSIPEGIEPPDTGITLELRPEFEQIFSAATLAYFLGASLVPGDDPRLKTEGGFEYPLEDVNDLETSIERVLKQTFLLDCITRTEGLYKVDLKEREDLEPLLTYSLADTYHEPLAKRIERYLQIPFSVIEDSIPQWGISAHMLPTPSSVEILPYLVDDLAIVHVHAPNSIERPQISASISEGMKRGEAGFTRSSSDALSPQTDFVKPPKANSVEQIWVGDGTPIGASKAIPQAYRNRLGRTPATSDIDITVICNDDAMNEEENLINEVYGSRDDLEFDLSLHRNLSKSELADILQQRTDFLHYIGHIDDVGFECRDGKLDIERVDEVGVSAFLLNACQSYTQGRHLIEGGAIGGIVTLSEVINAGAMRMGGTLARLLNIGFPLYAALDIAKTESLMGARYIVVGDGRVSLTQPTSIPHLIEIDGRANNFPSFAYMTYPTSRIDLGSMTTPQIQTYSKYALVSQRIDDIDLSRDEMLEFLHMEDMPVRLDGDLEWSLQIETI